MRARPESSVEREQVVADLAPEAARRGVARAPIVAVGEHVAHAPEALFARVLRGPLWLLLVVRGDAVAFGLHVEDGAAALRLEAFEVRRADSLGRVLLKAVVAERLYVDDSRARGVVAARLRRDD